MLPKEVHNEFFKIAKRVVLVVGILGFSAFSIGNIDVAVGVVAGGVISILSFRLMALAALQLVELNDPQKAKARAIINYLIRYILYAGVLYVGFVTPEINFVGIVVGLLMVKFVILFDGVYYSIKNYIQEFWKRQKLKYERRDS
ncbi:ATP synthase subunit I [Anaerobranca gottschalkii]|uniref:ATP synthase I chain n=1 Tax=Anaerobranca gottschalkii DSM 13577 TaxID=1120990 RepID=A0A1I0CAI0_9FIRM|nr:ATP synthase subunit I [Anaerobranca gottschalkii]SET16560.1 ATP synthase I chain [Anaerobranca gottschalkii DSM 13577]